MWCFDTKWMNLSLLSIVPYKVLVPVQRKDHFRVTEATGRKKISINSCIYVIYIYVYMY